MRLSYLTLIAIIPLSCGVAQTTWTAGGDGAFWEDSANWSNNLPTSSSGAVFNTDYSEIGFSSDFTVASLTFNTGVAVGNKITGLAGAGLTVNGAITNNTSNSQILNVIVTAGGNATWTGPIQYSNNVTFGTRQITLVGTHTFSGAELNFTLTNASTYGRLLGAFTSTFAGTINITGAYTGTAGDSFDFTTGNFSGATLNTASLPTLSSGLAWNTSSFLSTGVLSVTAVPEPSTYAALFGVASLGFVAWRRRRAA